MCGGRRNSFCQMNRAHAWRLLFEYFVLVMCHLHKNIHNQNVNLSYESSNNIKITIIHLILWKPMNIVIRWHICTLTMPGVHNLWSVAPRGSRHLYYYIYMSARVGDATVFLQVVYYGLCVYAWWILCKLSYITSI